MMKHLSFLAAAILCVSTVLASPNVPQNVKPLKVKQFANIEQSEIQTQAPVRMKQATAIPDDACDMYAFQLWGYGWITAGFLQFPSYSPADREFLMDYGYSDGSTTISAGTFVGDTYYAFVGRTYAGGAFLEPVGLATVDLETGDYWNVADYSQLILWNELFYEMSYDPKTQLIYAIQLEYDQEGYATNRTKLWTIDPFSEDYTPVQVATIDEYLWTMAVDNGVIYGIVQDYSTTETDEWGNFVPTRAHLISIDTETIANGACTVVEGAAIDGGKRLIDWSQSMEFDHTTHNLWWAGQGMGDGGGWICQIDVNNGTLSDYNVIPEFGQYVALGIPYQTAADNAPSYVTKLAVTPAAQGGLSATLTWNNPSTTYAMAELTELSGVKVYRNDELIADITSVQAGAAQTYTDNITVNGTYTYKIVPYNTAGDGIYKERSVYVGKDVPAAVTNVVITTEGCNATISWAAPTVGLNGGYISTDDIVYDIFRTPNDAIVAMGTTATSVTDVVNQFQGYTYTITAKNAQGAGGMYVSQPVAFGPGMSLPYNNELTTFDDFAKLTVVDSNSDGNTWYYSYDAMYAEYIYNANAANDYLATPALAVEAGEEYEVNFKYLTSTYTGCVEKLRVMVSYDPTFANAECILDMPSLQPGQGGVWHPKTTTFKATQSGDIFVAFHIYSDADMGFLRVDDIVVRYISSSDLRADKVFGSDMAYTGTPIVHRVNVTNTGSGVVTTGVVKLVDGNNNELGQAPVGEIAAGETKTIDVEWTPSTLGDMTVWGVVELEGDTYTGDNKTVEPVNVTVYSPEGDHWFSIGVPNNQGWRPIFLGQNYSEMQTLYYAKDITVSDFSFTGMQYLYNYQFDTTGLDAVPVSIYMQNTSMNSLTSLLPEETFTLVYSGNISVTGQEQRNVMTVKFDTPFEYTGENIVVKVVCDKTEVLPNVEWLIVDEDFLGLDCRSYCAYGDTRQAALANPFDNYYIPYIRFSYNAGGAVEGVAYQSSLVASKCGDMLYFNMVCDVVNVYSIAGELVYTASSVESVDLAQLAAGVYVVKAVSGNNTTVVKVLK